MSTNPNDDDKPATKRDLELAFHELREFVLERETALTWRLIGLVLALIAGQWIATYAMIQHWKP